MPNELEFLIDREKYWGDSVSKDDSNSPIGLMDSLFHYYKSKRILEIGPGKGRQYSLVKGIVENYHVADISENVLNLNIYKDIKKTKLNHYNHWLRKKFDVVHFWYVIHHVLPDELPYFFSFVKKHTKKNGYVLFNFPIIWDMPYDSLGWDGIKTSFTCPPIYNENIETNFKKVEHWYLVNQCIIVAQNI